MEFEKVREYQPGDDVRHIDWNVTARMRAPFIKEFREERELTVMLLVDVSSSGSFGSAKRLKQRGGRRGGGRSSPILPSTATTASA